MNDLHCLVNYKFVILIHPTLYSLKTNDLTHWSIFINIRVYVYTYIYIYWMLVWMISQVLSIISVLSCLTYHYTPWKRMSLPTDKCWSTGWNIRCTYWMFAWMISTDLSIISVLFDLSCPHTHWKLTHLSTFIDRMVCHIHIGCLYEWFQKSCHSQMCYPAPRVPIHIENEWSYPLINFFQLYVILYVYILCVCINDFACLVLIHV